MQNNDQVNSNVDKLAEKGKAVGKNAAKKAAIAVKNLAKKAILALLKAFAGPIAIILLICLGMIIAFEVVLNTQGTTQRYSTTYQNTPEQLETGEYIVTEENMNGESKVIRDFYKYHSDISYYQIVGNDRESLIRADSEDAITDYYNEGDIYKLNPNLLFALDEYLFERKFKYPEQFIKPVNFDKDTLTLKPLVDEQGLVNVESKEINIETGEETGNKIKSVRDYGLGSILVFNATQDWEKNVMLKGTYVKKEVWDNVSKKVVEKTISEPFSFNLVGYPQKINLVEKVISFAGEISLNYTYQENMVSEIQEGIAPQGKESAPYKRVHYDTYVHRYYVYAKDEDGNQKYDKYGMPVRTLVIKEHKLYKTRGDDSGIYEKVPVKGTPVTTNTEISYYEDYIENFESYIPGSVVSDFKFDERVDYESASFMDERTIVDDYQFSLGVSTDSKAFKNSLIYLPIVKKYATKFGIDPYVLFAMLVQESGGNPDINKNGLMQITSSSYTVSQTAKDAQGVPVEVSVTLPERKDPEKSIEYAAAYHKRLLDKYNGDVFKAIQAYNMGEGTMAYIARTYPTDWATPYGWLRRIEDARLHSGGQNTRSVNYKCIYAGPAKTSGSVWGDTCYLENVLRYYSTDNGQLKAAETQGNSWNLIANISSAYKKFINKYIVVNEDTGEVVENPDKTYIDFNKDIHHEMPEVIMRSAKTYDERIYYTETEYSESLNFWEDGFMQSMQSIGITQDQILGMVGGTTGYIPPIVLGNGIMVTSPFGNRVHPIYKDVRFHKGVDVKAPTGTNLYAIADGVVEIATQMNSGWGKYVKIKNQDGTHALYAHLSGFAVKQGDTVKAGQIIGFVGTTGASTGPHLHFEFHINGNPVDPINIIERPISARALDLALTKKGLRYVWGATGPNEFDCSGLVLWSYKQLGYQGMPRTSAEQSKKGALVDRANVQPGDLLFFKNNGASVVNHVAFYYGKNEKGEDLMFHAANKDRPLEIRTVYWNTLSHIRRYN